MLSAVKQNVLILSEFMPNIFKLNVIMLNVIMLNVVKLNVIMMNVFMLTAIMLHQCNPNRPNVSTVTYM